MGNTFIVVRAVSPGEVVEAVKLNGADVCEKRLFADIRIRVIRMARCKLILIELIR